MPVFLIHSPADASGCFDIPDSDLKHLTQVLRLKAGDCFQVMFPDGKTAEARLEKKQNRLEGRIEKILRTSSPPGLPLWLGISLIRWPRMEWLVEKLTELGVRRITPLLLERTRIPSKSKISNHKINRLRKISNETLKQCERPEGTRIDDPQELKEFLSTTQKLPNHPQKIFFNETVAKPLLSLDLLKRGREWVFLIGPEGGWSQEEILQSEAAGFQSVSLGDAVLRTETAAICSAWTVHLQYDDES